MLPSAYACPPDVIWMCLKSSNALLGVVVVTPEVEIIRTTDEPVLTSYEGHASHWDLCDFESLDESASFVIPDEHISGIKASEQPRFTWMKVDRLDAR